MVTFITIISVLVVLNALLLIFSTTLPFRFKKRTSPGISSALDLKIYPLDRMDSEYRNVG